MKHWILLSLIIFSNSFANPAEFYSLTVEVEKLRNSQGEVQFSLYNKDETIPDEKYTKYFKMKKGKIIDASSKAVFNNLPKGNYAINILHDENQDGKIDKGFFLPKEGIGFSNYTSVGPTNRPNFKKASFQIESDTEVEINIIYF